MGFAARKSKSGEVTLTTEMVQDGILFITNLLFKNQLPILASNQVLQLGQK